MSAFDMSALLSAWEEAASQPPVRRAITLLAAARPTRSAGEWEQIRLGARDSALLDLQDEIFGRELETTAECPECGARVELAFSTSHVRASATDTERVKVIYEEYTIECRLPNSGDLLRLPQSSMEAARMALMERCVERIAGNNGAEVAVRALSSPALDAIAAAMSDADPQAEVLMDIGCPECGHRWPLDFDIVSYLWTEVQDWAYRILREVHVLASAYGWSERDVLMMSSRRRHLYMNMVEG